MTAYQTPSVRNITSLFRLADADAIAEGAAWYARARGIAEDYAAQYGVTVEIAAGIIAATSPMNGWGANVALAGRFLAAGGLDAGYLKAQLAKARAILAGADPVATLSGLKTQNFYRGIVSAGADGVCIDRHAYCLAVNDRSVSNSMPKLTAKQYAEVADCYRRAAVILSREYGQTFHPAQVQSVTWTLWRRMWWSEGAFDGERAA